MKPMPFISMILLAVALIPAACGRIAVPPTEPTAAVVLSPSAVPQPTAVPLSFTPVVYTDPSQRFELDYPSDWTSVPLEVVGARGSQGALFSPGTTAENLPAGGTRVMITVYQWDPRHDLAAYADHRKGAWDSDGHSIVKESGGELPDGRKYMSFTVKGPDGVQAFFLLTELGEKYLELAGEGDLALVEEIARSLRPVGFKP